MTDDNKEQKRFLPRSELDFNLMTTDPAVGRQGETNAELYSKMRRKVPRIVQDRDHEGNPLFYTDEKGEPDQSRPVLIYEDRAESLWAELGIFTRDLRLSNLDNRTELPLVNHYMDLAIKFGVVDMHEAQVVCVGQVSAITEPAQSKGGFLRQKMNTLRTEQVNIDEEPPKKKLFGKGKDTI